MSYLDLYISPSTCFSGFSKPLREAKFAILGVPYDGTATFRPGARFGPNAIREASMNIETNSLRSGIYVEDLKICDVGNLHILDDPGRVVKRLSAVVKELDEGGKIPLAVGGEHTVTLGMERALKGVAILDFDAHMDLRNEYAGRKLSHATFMRRIAEDIGAERIVQVGIRAFCKEESKFARRAKVAQITSVEVNRVGAKDVVRKLRDLLSSYERIHLTIDMDVLDPSQAPATQCPEPDGISTSILLDVLHGVVDERFRSFDLTEVVPQLDFGVTSTQASKIIFETLCYMQSAER